ncbi:Vacuolar segregation protein 7 [Fusarium oxysporum f. sp. cubense race 1]|uniref:Vacuolar segregation protein 7 n=1 Tax=Fusarium oxysporum f. sp. cubense (strain race 1) TaxID=1229664 RepID=N4TVR4_FUSC1|nr:Vacuolar segregation protein 7 [Fusarium oxysporum f. sp. cubense race 1]
MDKSSAVLDGTSGVGRPSPLASRDSSPTRRPRRTASANRLPEQQQQQIQAPTPQKPGFNVDLKDSPRWPVSPRLRSPPPQFSNRPAIPARRSEQDLPSISVQRPTPSPQPMEQQTISESEMEESQYPSGMRTPARVALETVQEVSLPNSPNPPSGSALVEKVKEKLSSTDNYSDTALPDGRALRAKNSLSTETIKPKKDKKKVTRKQPPVNAGNASSKADVFEATIASAVDEANTSDSEETFVYDSNPPDGNDRAGRRFHSRTPSATSMASQADRQNLRSIYGIMESGGPAHGPKKTMKFVNTFTSNGNESLAVETEDGKGSNRSGGSGSTRGTTRHHHHIGRWGRQPGNGHASLFDNESPFPNAARSKLAGPNSRNSSGPPSPRNAHSNAPRHFGHKRSAMQMSSSYDMDDTTGADDERTPLLGSVRSGRSGRSRRGPHNLRQAESQTFARRSSYLNRFAACLVLTMMFMLVITGAIGFMFATSQPMTGIEITAIHNVVTSDQVLMFDLTVKAHNPNIVVVTIDHANLEVFAKSEYTGTDSDWWARPFPHGPDDLRVSDDPENDPPLDDPDPDDDLRPNVLLGRITEFDSPLTFEGSLFHQGTSSSTGEMQLEYPLNNTVGGSRRWERIYQNEFDLISSDERPYPQRHCIREEVRQSKFFKRSFEQYQG